MREFVALSLIIACGGCRQPSEQGLRREPDANTGHGSNGRGPAGGTGGCGDAGTDADTSPLGPVRTLAEGLDAPTRLVLDGDYLYWVNTSNGSHGSVMRIAKTGGKPQVLAAEQISPVGLVVDAHDVYWTNAGIGAATGQVMRVAKTGGKSIVVASGLNWPSDLVGDRDYLYWRDDRKGLQRIAKRGGVKPKLLVASETLSGAIAVDDTRVYFNDVGGGASFNNVSFGAILSIPKSGGPISHVASLPAWFISILAVDGDDIYWHNGGVDSLWHAKTTGGDQATPVFVGGFEMRHIAVTKDALFITQMGQPPEMLPGPGAIHEISRDGGPDLLVTPRDVGFWGIAVDDKAIYWTNLSKGTLSTIAR
jgi:hypothetical protein